MLPSKLKINIEPTVDWQTVYDDLVMEKKLIELQIEELAKKPEICTHPIELIKEADD